MGRSVRTDGPRLAGRLQAWSMHHGHSAFATLGRLYMTPLATVMSVAVIGIALALPAGLHMLVDNARQLSGTWERAMDVSVFLKHDVQGAAVDALVADLTGRHDIGAVRVIPAAEALVEFRDRSGFGAALDILHDNPLPTVLVVTPAPSVSGPAMLAPMVDHIEARPEVELVQLDIQWLQRLFALLDIVGRAILAVAILLGLAVVITVGNTIRLDIQNRRSEIEVTKLIGGSDAFIRRPFLYAGFWFGVLGGLTAWVLVTSGLALLSGPVARLSGMYGSTWALDGLGLGGLVALCGGGALLGWAGAWVAVGRHLDDIEPT